MRLLAALAPVALLLAAPPLTGCGGAPAPRVCAGAGVCGAGYCVAGRCRPADALPAPLDARRMLLPPEDLAVLEQNGDAAPAVPDAAALGRASTGDVVLLLRFTPPFGEDAEIASAFVVLQPAPGAPPAGRALTLEVARILEPWRSATATWGRQPRLSVPEPAAIAPRRPVTPLRIDVTSLVRGWAKRRRDDHGIAILAPGNDAVGAAYTMGLSQGVGPQLEVYVR
ncbi:DNRLRE domain-containing protein [Sorangium cellulosum]|uniref:DNRLRE domain-containing protein n=1 Tax=Sorangium cellulosum TaxID=56 RepID=UPI001F5DD05A|nr:DNRLRE domain-containing protein [Sorangium cellulosum]